MRDLRQPPAHARSETGTVILFVVVVIILAMVVAFFT
jgi:flagellin-like protein